MPDPAPRQVERSVTVEAPVEVVWGALRDRDGLAEWLGRSVDFDAVAGSSGRVVDDDGTERLVRVDEVEPGRRMSWHWWPEDGGNITSVEIVLEPDPADDRTRITVTETAQAGATPGPRCLAGGWSDRVLSLELAMLATPVRV